MKIVVTAKLVIETDDYSEFDNMNESGLPKEEVLNLVEAMFRDEADWPNEVTIEYEGKKRTIDPMADHHPPDE